MLSGSVLCLLLWLTEAARHIRSKSSPGQQQAKENTPPDTARKSLDKTDTSVVQLMGRLSLEDEQPEIISPILTEETVLSSASEEYLDEENVEVPRPSIPGSRHLGEGVATIRLLHKLRVLEKSQQKEQRDSWDEWDWERDSNDVVIYDEIEQDDEEAPEEEHQYAYSVALPVSKPLFSAANTPELPITPASSRRARKIPLSLLMLTIQGAAISERYNVDGFLGKGSYGRVYRAHLRLDPSQQVAIKIIDLDQFDDSHFGVICKYLEAELTILQKLRGSPRLLQLREVYGNIFRRRLSIVTDLVDGFSLTDLIDWIIASQSHMSAAISLNSSNSNNSSNSSNSNNSSNFANSSNQIFPTRIIAHIAKDLVSALSVMHNLRIAHQDVKSMNVMLKETGEAILIDFGMSHQFENHETHHEHKGSLSWMSPEMLFAQGSSIAVDIWSLGVTMLELITGLPLIKAHDVINARLLMRKVIKNGVILPSTLDPLLADFITRCLTVDPWQRPTATDLLKHPFIEQAAADETEMTQFIQQMTQLKALFGGRKPRRPFEDPITPASQKPTIRTPPRHHKSL